MYAMSAWPRFSVMRDRNCVLNPWSTWMPSRYSLVADSGMPSVATTNPAGTNAITAEIIQCCFPRVHSTASTAAMPNRTNDTPVANDLVTMEVLNAGSEIWCSTNHAASERMPPASPAATVRTAACPGDSSSG